MIGIRHVLDGCVACDQKMIILRAQNLRFGELSQVQSQQPTGIQSAPQQIMVHAGTFLSRGQFFASNRGMTPCAVVFIWYRGFTNGSPPPSFAENSTSYNSCVLKLSRYQSQARWKFAGQEHVPIRWLWSSTEWDAQLTQLNLAKALRPYHKSENLRPVPL